MDREKLIKQLFVGKVAEIIGSKKATELLKDATISIDQLIKSTQQTVVKSFNEDNCINKNE